MHNFHRAFEEVWQETKNYYAKILPKEIEAEHLPKYKMSLIFHWYFIHTMCLSLQGKEEQVGDDKIHCGSAMGAFKQCVIGTPYEKWQNPPCR